MDFNHVLFRVPTGPWLCFSEAIPASFGLLGHKWPSMGFGTPQKVL